MRVVRSIRFATVASLLAASVMLPIAASHAAEPIVFENWNSGGNTRDPGVYAADDSGAGIRLLTAPGAAYHPLPAEPALSPDGSKVTYFDDCAGLRCLDSGVDSDIWVIPWSGGAGNVAVGGLWQNVKNFNPTFTPDGQSLVFTRVATSSSTNTDIYTANTDGTGLRPVIAWSSYEREAGVSPDGSKLVFVSSPTGNVGSFTLYVSDINGQNARSLGIVGATYPRFSPDGSKIAYSNENDGKIYTIPTAGGTPTALTKGGHNVQDQQPDWSPDGARVVYTHCGSSTCDIHRIGYDGRGDTTIVTMALHPHYRQPQTTGQQAAGWAEEFRPVLLFDSTEHWRPLNVSQFAQEKVGGVPLHLICTATQCQQMTSINDLRSFPSGAWINIGQVNGNYESPYPECQGQVVWDCDAAGDTRSAIYYEATTRSAGYNYIDYWWFLRYNELDVDVHAGDWEGVTVAPSLTVPGTFDFVGFSQHSTINAAASTPSGGDKGYYLRQNIECDAGGIQSCGTASSPTGQRARVYVAAGSQAAYPRACYGSCTQDTSLALPEGNHDGLAPWGRNNDAWQDAVLPFPQPLGWADPSSANWVDWPGHWGQTGAPGFTSTFNSPGSPGTQTRFKCPWKANPLDNTACSARVRARARAAVIDRAASLCRNWFGGAVTVLACDRDALGQGLAHGRLGSRGTLRLAAPRGITVASAPGLAQAVGRPLDLPARLSVSATAATPAALWVRVLHGKRVYGLNVVRSLLVGWRPTQINIRWSRRGVVVTAERHGRLLLRRIVRPS